MPVIPVLGQEDSDFKASLGYIGKVCIKKKKSSNIKY
jgi:hypothetical protein